MFDGNKKNRKLEITASVKAFTRVVKQEEQKIDECS